MTGRSAGESCWDAVLTAAAPNFPPQIGLPVYIMYMGKAFSKWSVLVSAGLVLAGAVSLGQPAVDRPGQIVVPNYRQPQPNQNPSAIKVARLHYGGGGDWYWGGSSIPNLLTFIRQNTDYPVDTLEKQVTIMDPDLFKYPFLFATGHGLMKFSPEEKERLRKYLVGGGFLFVNDSYGMNATFRDEMANLFPERQVVEVPFDHPLYHCFYDFPNGPPKIHEHDGKPPRGYAIIINGRVVLYFLIESDIGDGWEDPQVHNDPETKRLEAFKMGVNLVTYALLN